MGDLKPIVAVAASMGAIVVEGWLRRKMHRFDEDYVSILDLVYGTAARIPGRRRVSRLRPSPKSSPRFYRAASSWLSGSNIASLEGQLEE